MTILIDYGKAKFEYELLEQFEAGIELLGLEVKTLRSHRGSLEGAHIIVREGEAYILNMFIPPYQENNTPSDYDPRRTRKLILTKGEIKKLTMNDRGQNLTVVPISVYTKDNLIKVSIALVRGKKRYDKRESIKKRETDRTISREMKDR